jgi:hypothetical protein
MDLSDLAKLLPDIVQTGPRRTHDKRKLSNTHPIGTSVPSILFDHSHEVEEVFPTSQSPTGKMMFCSTLSSNSFSR